MAIFDIFSKRQKELRGEVPDVFTYDDIPQTLRVQIVHIWLETLGKRSFGQVKQAYEFIVETLCREYGIFRLPGAKDYGDRDYINELSNFILQESDIEKVVDGIELSFKIIDRFTRSREYRNKNNASELADSAIKELNSRLN